MPTTTRVLLLSAILSPSFQLDSEIIHDLKVVTFQCFSLYTIFEISSKAGRIMRKHLEQRHSQQAIAFK